MDRKDKQTEIEVLARFRAACERGPPLDPRLVDDVGALLNAHWRWVYGRCRRVVGDSVRAEELTQEVMTIAWSKLPTFEGNSKLSTWLFQIAYFTCRRAVEKRADLLTEDGVFYVEDAMIVAPIKRLRRQERADLVNKATLGLPELEQEVIYLRYVEHLPYKAINTMLDLQNSGARALLQKCKRHLEKGIREQLEELGVGSSFLHSSGT